MTNNPTRGRLILTRGIPGSGKSSWALEWVAESPESRVRLSRDDLRSMLHGKRWGLPGGAEQAITRYQHAIARDALDRGLDVVVDGTNLRARDVRAWQAVGEVLFQDFPIDVDEAVRRDADREHPVGEAVVRGFAARFTKEDGALPVPPEPAAVDPITAPYVPDESLDQAYLFDIDGTLAHIVPGGRSPYDGARVGEDVVDPAVAGLLAHLEQTFHVVLVSGRDETYRPETEAWLLDNRIRYDELHMRPAGDTRKDDVVKLDLFDSRIRHRWNVLGVFDDRNRVVAAWRSIGLKCFQVQEGNF